MAVTVTVVHHEQESIRVETNQIEAITLRLTKTLTSKWLLLL